MTALKTFQRFEKGEIELARRQGIDLVNEIKRRQIDVTRLQGDRETCSVFAMTFLLEYAYAGQCGNEQYQYSDLSEEYLNHATNLLAKNDNDGDFFVNLDKAYQTSGIILETDLRYRETYDKATLDRIFARGQLALKSALLTMHLKKLHGKFIRENDGTEGLTDLQFEKVLNYLDRGIPVAIGRAHSTVAVAYTVNEDFPDRGQFVLRDSLESDGFSERSFEDLKKTTCDAFVYLVKDRAKTSTSDRAKSSD